MSGKQRLPLIDLTRGCAILLMVIYHFCYDLYYFGYLDTAFGKGYWIPFRYVIVISFLILVGVSLVLVHQQSIKWPNMIKRSGQLLAASVAVTASSYFIAPDKMTLFGILHFILVASWLTLPLLDFPKLSLLLGLAIFTAGHVFSFSWLNPTVWHWIGMVETKRLALDYVPIFPWLGVVLAGVYVGHLLQRNTKIRKFAEMKVGSDSGLLRLIGSGLEWSGKHSLVIYLVHQPLMFGAFLALN
jgi:uncharacterized membrane protein